jgi:hypothetical protein
VILARREVWVGAGCALAALHCGARTSLLDGEPPVAALEGGLPDARAIVDARSGDHDASGDDAVAPFDAGPCVPSCTAHACGASDGCGGTCATGSCATGLTCNAGNCEPSRAILFGGAGEEALLADTWTCDGAAWTQLHVTGPSARQGAVMAAVGDGSLILFGGLVGSAPGGVDSHTLGDTWRWDGHAWMQLPVKGPPARAEAMMAPFANGSLVLFGGEDDGGLLLADTWVWDGAAWSEQTIQGPSGRYASALATLGAQTFLFDGEGLANGLLPDAWTWNGAVWSALSATGPAPSARFAPAITPLDGTLLLFGGLAGGIEYHAVGDTWSWNGAAWARLATSGPPPRYEPTLATAGAKAVLFGGRSATPIATFADTWTWDGSTWTRLDGPGPTARAGAVMATP